LKKSRAEATTLRNGAKNSPSEYGADSSLGWGSLALFAAAWYMGALRYKQATSWIIQAHLALERLHDLRYSMAQAGSRSAIFVVSGDNANLAPFQASQTRAREDLNSLRELTRGSQLQQQMLDSLVPVVQTRLTFTSNIVAVRISRGQEAAAELLKSEQLRKVVEEFDARIEQIESAEQQLLSSRLSIDHFLARIAIIVVICSVALGFVAIGSAGKFISRAFAMMRLSITDEASGRETLRHLNERLEGWITERTAAAEERTLELEHSQGALHRQTPSASVVARLDGWRGHHL
jgi:CHASE3 domain sensor protein